MLAIKFQKELEERYGAKITAIEPFEAEPFGGEVEQFYEVHMKDSERAFYMNVDEFGAVLGQMTYAE